MTTPINDRISRPPAERPVQQVKSTETKRTETAADKGAPTRAALEDKARASSHADKGRHVDRYA